MVKKCPQCNKVDIEDKYMMCMNCLKEMKSANESLGNGAVTDLLKKINWNLGSISQTLKLGLLSEFETLKNGGMSSGRSKIQQKMHGALLKDMDKYLKVLKDIQEEQEK